jgi:hypothetical protein
MTRRAVGIVQNLTLTGRCGIKFYIAFFIFLFCRNIPTLSVVTENHKKAQTKGHNSSHTNNFSKHNFLSLNFFGILLLN